MMPQHDVESRRLTKSPGSLLVFDTAARHRVLVMWGHGCFGPHSDFDTQELSEFLPRWLSNRLSASTSDFESWQTLNPLQQREARRAEFVACGWPATALCGRIDGPGHPSQDYNTYTHNLILLDTTMSSLDFPKCMPLRPLMPGFAINTLFYAALCWLLFAAPFAARRAIRRRRNRCLRCKRG